ncbi:PADRE domain [Dillenia turbinata]|uniref:PADRE domain n=1 Tax=Dillenia turbinata TaxID=194707 RepID=A0AAN8VW46_9MAGN
MEAALLKGPSASFDTIRIVHLNGIVEEFENPITVCEVTGKPPEHFICTPAQLLTGSSSNPLKPTSRLEPGRVYFLLPFSAFQPDVSPMDLASIVSKLNKIAKSWPGSGKSPSPSPGRCSPARSPNRVEPDVGNKKGVIGVGRQKWPNSGSWKPILDTIRERSFNRRSESDILRHGDD